MIETTREAVIRCDGIWKIFGEKSHRAMDAVLGQGLSKDEIRPSSRGDRADRGRIAGRAADDHAGASGADRLAGGRPAGGDPRRGLPGGTRFPRPGGAAKLFELAKIDINDLSAQNKLIADGQDKSEDIDRNVDA
ncbi:MAG TPA: hypothetical protein VGA75_11725 [Paracoccaceae bacterium]